MNALIQVPVELDGLTGIRGVLALWVVFVHILTALLFSHVVVSTWLPDWVILTTQHGAWAVDGFFMLSGFVLSHVYGERMGAGFDRQRSLVFLGHRIARIYPVHLAVLAAYVAAKMSGVVFAVETCGNPMQPLACDRFALTALAKQLLLVSSWSWYPTTSWNVVAWSISSEWFAYVCFSVLILLAPRIRGMTLSLVLAALAIAAALVALLALKHTGRGPIFDILEEFGLIRVSGGFLCGALLYRAYLSPGYRKIAWQWMGPACLVGLVLGINSPWPWTPPFFLALILLSVAQPNGPLSRVLSTQPMLWLGKISYALYMCHLFVLEMLGVAFKDPSATPLSQLSGWQILGVTSFLVSVPILFAALLHYAVEEPGRKWLRRVFDRLTQKPLEARAA